MKIDYTNRGFVRGDFTDRCGEECSIQESSAMVPCIWLGTSDNRMHLTQTMVSNLLPLLQHFVKHGTLPKLRKRQGKGGQVR